MKNVPHYKKDGTLYKGNAIHKDNKGKIMSGKNHTPSSVYLFHLKDLSKNIQAKIKTKK